MVRAYKLKTVANVGKLDSIAAILPAWQQGLGAVQRATIRCLRDGETKLGYTDTKHLPEPLSQRQWKSVVNQVNANMRSWRELAKIEFRRYVTNSSLPDETKVALYRINIRAAWWNKTGAVSAKLTVSKGDLRLARQIIRQVLKRRCPFPNLSGCNTMLMDGPVAQVEAGKNTHDYWVRISTLERGKVVRVPLQSYDYFEADPGKLSNFCQVNVKDGTPTFTLVKSKPCAPTRENGEVLGLDWGLHSLFTTSDGDQLGRRLYPWLQVMDSQLAELARQLQKNGVKPNDSRRYRAFQARIKGYVRNEVGRVLNKVAVADVAELCVEDLDFRGGGLSRKLNRIVSRAGRAAVKAKLVVVEEDTGIKVTSGNAAYTSQECSGCGYIHKLNRKSQDKFECGFCGKKCHADFNSANVHVLRRPWNEQFQYRSAQQVKASLDEAFASRWGTGFADVSFRRSDAAPSPQRLHSGAPGASTAQLTGFAEDK